MLYLRNGEVTHLLLFIVKDYKLLNIYAMEMHDAHDSDALKEKLTDTLPILKIYAFTLTGDAARAADLLQETSVKVLCNFASYTININFKGWATTIMHNIFVNEYKRAARSVSVADDTFFDCECHCCDVDAAEIMAAISALPCEHCKAFTMYADGYKYEEIAEEMGIPLGTVKSRIHTARIRLQRMLKDYAN